MQTDPVVRRFVIAIALAAVLAGCTGVSAPAPAGDECAYPGASVQCRGLNPG